MLDFKRLRVWARGHELVKQVYAATATYPAKERFELRSQVRRAASSIPTNVAEGAGRRSRRDYARFLDIAIASCSELEYHLILALDLGFLEASDSEALQAECREVRAMLIALQDRVLSGDD